MFHDQRQNGDLAPTSEDLARVATANRFRLTESEIGDGCREFGVEGELDMVVSDQLREAIANCQEERILVSLRACQFIDSTGIALILQAHHDSAAEIVVHSPRNQVLRVLEVTGLIADGLVFADREEALSALAQTASA